MENLKNKAALTLHKAGVSANFLSYSGLCLAFLSAALITRGVFLWAAGAVLLSGILDLLDGAVARAAGKAGKFGGILDSSLDRYGDGFILGALILFFAERQYFLTAALGISALLGSFSISYVRARAECEIPGCRVGFWERGERMVYISLGLLLNNITLVLWVLGVVTHLTALQRLWLARKKCKAPAGESRPQTPSFLKDFILGTHGRKSPLYAVKVTIWILLLAFFRVLPS